VKESERALGMGKWKKVRGREKQLLRPRLREGRGEREWWRGEEREKKRDKGGRGRRERGGSLEGGRGEKRKGREGKNIF
jgi:hypothetical protein